MTATTTVRPTRLLALPTWLLKHKALVAFCALVGAYYLWTVWSSGSPIAFDQPQTDHYNLLADGFLSGHLHLNVTPDPRLLALPNPYDPVANAGLKAQDLSLYHGKYYLYWGPTPVLLLLHAVPVAGARRRSADARGLRVCLRRLLLLDRLPARARPALHARRTALDARSRRRRAGLRQRLALHPAARVRSTRSRSSPGSASRSSRSTSSSPACATASGPVALGAASLLIGLAVGARPTMIVWALGLAVLAAGLYRRTPDRRTRRQAVGVLLGPVMAIGLLLMLYNVLRFDSPIEFGTKYQLTAFDPGTYEGNKLAYVPPGLWYYLLSPLNLTLGFPFINLPSPPTSYPFTAPLRYDGVEMVSGLLATTPFIVFALLAPAVLRGTARRVTLGLIAVAFLIVVMVSFALWGVTMRYEVDFASLLLIAAALGWIGWAVRLQRSAAPAAGRRRRAPAHLGRRMRSGVRLQGLLPRACGASSPHDLHAPAGPHQPHPDPGLRHRRRAQDRRRLRAPRPGERLRPHHGRGHGDLSPWRRRSRRAHGRQRVGPQSTGCRLSAAPPQPPPKGTIVQVRLPDTNTSFRIPDTFAPTIFPISLRRGLNRIQFRVLAPAGAATRLVDVQITPFPGAGP